MLRTLFFCYTKKDSRRGTAICSCYICWDFGASCRGEVYSGFFAVKINRSDYRFALLCIMNGNGKRSHPGFAHQKCSDFENISCQKIFLFYYFIISLNVKPWKRTQARTLIVFARSNHQNIFLKGIFAANWVV